MELPEYRHQGAHALVRMHADALREFVVVWREADGRELCLPASADPAYASRAALLHHVLRCARSYLTWMCEVLGLPDPGVREPPPVAAIAAAADDYVAHVLDRWRTPLAGVTEAACERPEYPSRWGPRYCIDAMLEHAVMHPLRHTFQLRRLLAGA